jgi:hypothetical protein
MLKTMHMPQNLSQLCGILPKSNYDDLNPEQFDESLQDNELLKEMPFAHDSTGFQPKRELRVMTTKHQTTKDKNHDCHRHHEMS